jgi:hypothetical protein
MVVTPSTGAGPLLFLMSYSFVCEQRWLLRAGPGALAPLPHPLYFTLEDSSGGTATDLCPSGRTRAVTDSNKFEFVDLVVQRCLVKDPEDRVAVCATTWLVVVADCWWWTVGGGPVVVDFWWWTVGAPGTTCYPVSWHLI